MGLEARNPLRLDTFGMGIERWFGILKAKLKAFYNNFPYNSSLRSIARYLQAFIAIYNWVLKNGLS